MEQYGLIAFLFLLAAASQIKILGLLRSSRMKSVMIFEMKIEDLLEDIIRDTSVDRALLCRIHNGGGRIVIGADKKISIVCEPGASLAPHTKETYQNVPIDKQYRTVLIDMMESKDTFVFNLMDREPYGMLKRKTEADGITATIHFFINETQTSVYFVFLGTTGDPNDLVGMPTAINKIEEKVHIIRNTCRRAARLKLLK